MKLARTTFWIAAVLLVGSAAFAGTATVAPGDRISGTLADGDADTLSFYVGTPSSLDLKAKLDKELRVGFRVFGPDGSEQDASDALVILCQAQLDRNSAPFLTGLVVPRNADYDAERGGV